MRLGKHYFITHANLIGVEKGEVLSDYALEVRDGFIGEIAKELPNPENLPVVDLKGSYLMRRSWLSRSSSRSREVRAF